jgi:hypothetical protein
MLAVILVLQTWYFGAGNVPLSLWSATLFRDNQTAVDAGNGAAHEKLMEENTNYFGFFLSNSPPLPR